MKVGVITFPGTLDDRDALRAASVAGTTAISLWHDEADLKGVDAVILPGGFSYGDYLRCGAISRFAPVMTKVIDAANGGMPLLGICNGFQILIESGLLPGALINNKNVKFLSQNVTLKVASTNSIFTQDLSVGEKLDMPIAHRQGNFFASDDLLKKLQDDDQVEFTYDENPNGLFVVGTEPSIAAGSKEHLREMSNVSIATPPSFTTSTQNPGVLAFTVLSYIASLSIVGR